MPKKRTFRSAAGASLVEMALLILLILMIAIPSIKLIGHIPKKAVCGYMHGGERGFEEPYYDPDSGHCVVEPMDFETNYFF